MPKRLSTLMYVFGLLLVTVIIFLVKPPNSEDWSATYEFPVTRCDGYEVWAQAEAIWRRERFHDRETNRTRVTDLLEEWNVVYYNRESPAVRIQQSAIGLGENLETTLWLRDDRVVDAQEKGNPFRLVIPDVGALTIWASRGEAAEWDRFDAVPEDDTGAALCQALSA